jgi:ATP-binding cassette subfamily B protein
MASEQTEDLKKSQQRQGGPGHRGPAGMMPGEKAKNFGKTMQQLLRYLKNYRWKLIVVFVFAVASTIFAIVTPKILGNMTNSIVDDYISIKTYDEITKRLPEGTTFPEGTTLKTLSDQQPSIAKQLESVPKDQQEKVLSIDLSEKPVMHFEVLGQTALWLIVLYLLSAIFGYIQGWIVSGVTKEVTFGFRRDIVKKINRLPLRYFDNRSYGDVLSRITNDVDTISQSLGQSLSQMITSVTMIVGIIVMMLSISLEMTGIAVIVVPVSMVFIALIVGRSQKYLKRQQDTLGKINGHIEEIYAGHSVVKVFGGEKRALKTFNIHNESLHESAWKSQFLSGLMFPIMNFVSNLGYVAVAIMGGWLAINGRVTIGGIQAFIQYLQQFNQPLMQVANITNVVQSTAAAAERVFEFLDEPEETRDASDAKVLERAKGAVDFTNVAFSYTEGTPIINDFSASVKPGQTVAIVGPTGAGKTTMVNLLMRFYDSDSGTITIDGVATKHMKRADVRKNFAMVLQDTWLFNGTVRENLAYGNLEATEDQIIEAAHAAHADHFIRSLPHGYDTILGEDAENISAGEKQLLTIARAMLADAPMLILDEATSNVDTRTEILIQKAMRELMKGRTSFVIAHRLSTIRDADLILVMNHGDIVEHGTHSELLAADGFYAKLYNSQFVEN